MPHRLTLEYWATPGGAYMGKFREVPGIFGQAESLEDLEADLIEAFTARIRGNDFITGPEGEAEEIEIIYDGYP